MKLRLKIGTAAWAFSCGVWWFNGQYLISGASAAACVLFIFLAWGEHE